jgi:formylglycine-generating enzyme required for sulfatase activity
MGSNRLDAEAGYQLCAAQVANDCKLTSFLREQPEREVWLSPFYLDRTEVSTAQLAQWASQEKDISVDKSPVSGRRIDRWVRQHGTLLLDLYPTLERSSGLLWDGQIFSAPPGRENKPATQVTWQGAARYCAAQGKRLPTEAEWEFAARRSPSFLYPWGNVPPRCADVVFRGSLGQTCSRDSGPRDVGMSPQDETPDGIRDLGGSVSEWVQDAFFSPYLACPTAGCRDPVAQPQQEGVAVERVIRGGNWEWSAAALRGLARSRLRSDQAVQMVGFRCARSAEP